MDDVIPSICPLGSKGPHVIFKQLNITNIINIINIIINNNIIIKF